MGFPCTILQKDTSSFWSPKMGLEVFFGTTFLMDDPSLWSLVFGAPKMGFPCILQRDSSDLSMLENFAAFERDPNLSMLENTSLLSFDPESWDNPMQASHIHICCI